MTERCPSHRNRTHRHDVANPHQSPLRSARSHPAVQKTLDTLGYQLRPELDNRSVRDAWSGVGNVARSPNVPCWRHHGRNRAMYRHGHGMESTRRRGWRVLRHSRRREFDLANHTLLTICRTLHRRGWFKPLAAPPIWRSSNFSVDRTFANIPWPCILTPAVHFSTWAFHWWRE